MIEVGIYNNADNWSRPGRSRTIHHHYHHRSISIPTDIIWTMIDNSTDEGTKRVIKPSFPPRIRTTADSAFALSRLLYRSPPSWTILAAIAVARHYGAMILMRDVLFCISFPSYLMLANNRLHATNGIVRRMHDDRPRRTHRLVASPGSFLGISD